MNLCLVAQLEVSKPEPTKSLVVFEGLKLFDHNFIVFKKRLSFVIFQNLSVFSISSTEEITFSREQLRLIPRFNKTSAEPTFPLALLFPCLATVSYTHLTLPTILRV